MELPNMKLWNLKEEAKWAHTTQSQMQAIQELATFGELAKPFLEEILAVSVSEEIKARCIETMKAIDGKPSSADISSTDAEPQKIKKNIQEEKTAKNEKEPT
jgi:hypothetical protein